MGIVGLKTPSSDITIVESSISHELHPQSREIWASAARLVSSLFPLHLPPARLEDVKKCNEYYLTESLHVLKSLRQSKRVISVMFQSVCLRAGLQQLNLPGSKEFPRSVCQTAACILVVVGGVGDGGRGRVGEKKEIYSLRGRRTMPAHGGSSYVGGCSGMEPGLDNVT